MSAGAIIGLGSGASVNAAPASALEALYNYLANQNLPGYFVINGYGEALGPSPARQWTPEQVAAFVKSGGIWVDYCGWPMYYETPAPDGFDTAVGGTGWNEFVSALGVPWLQDLSFLVPTQDQTIYGGSYPYDRGFPVGSVRNHADWQAAGIASGFARFLAIHVPGGGWYFYGAGRTGSFGGLFSGVTLSDYVSPSDYAAFMAQTIAQGVPTQTPSSSSSTSSTGGAAMSGSGASLASCQGTLLEEGSTGPCVVVLQRRLNQLIGAGLATDGIFGPLTQAAVRTFQAQQGITVDGIVGPVTWAHLVNPTPVTPTPSGTTPSSQSTPSTTTPAPSTGPIVLSGQAPSASPPPAAAPAIPWTLVGLGALVVGGIAVAVWAFTAAD